MDELLGLLRTILGYVPGLGGFVKGLDTWDLWTGNWTPGIGDLFLGVLTIFGGGWGAMLGLFGVSLGDQMDVVIKDTFGLVGAVLTIMLYWLGYFVSIPLLASVVTFRFVVGFVLTAGRLVLVAWGYLWHSAQ